MIPFLVPEGHWLSNGFLEIQQIESAVARLMLMNPIN